MQPTSRNVVRYMYIYYAYLKYMAYVRGQTSDIMSDADWFYTFFLTTVVI